MTVVLAFLEVETCKSMIQEVDEDDDKDGYVVQVGRA